MCIRDSFSPTVGCVAAGIVAVDSLSILQAPLILTETFFTFLVVLALLLWVVGQQRKSWRLFALAGLLLGAAALVRPVFLYLPVVLVVMALLARKRALIPVVMIALSVVPPAVWLVRNHDIA